MEPHCGSLPCPPYDQQKEMTMPDMCSLHSLKSDGLFEKLNSYIQLESVRKRELNVYSPVLILLLCIIHVNKSVFLYYIMLYG